MASKKKKTTTNKNKVSSKGRNTEREFADKKGLVDYGKIDSNEGSGTAKTSSNAKISDTRRVKKIDDDLVITDRSNSKLDESHNNINDTRRVKLVRKRPLFFKLLVVILLLSSVSYFVVSVLGEMGLEKVINGLLLLSISVFLVAGSWTNYGKNRMASYLTIFLLSGYQILGILVSTGVINLPSREIGKLVGRSLTEVMALAKNNNISLTQEYEYSDLIDEYHIIYQSANENQVISKVKNLTVVISEGPSPYKEVVIPNMVSWSCDEVLEFINKNHLSNVLVEFVEGNVDENTLIEQSKSGNVRRNEEIKFTFSFGEERHYSEVKLANLSKRTEFEAEFYLKQYGIKYEFVYDFSDTISKGYVISQDVKPGEVVSISGDDIRVVKVTISKGKKIIVPDLEKMDMEEIVDWVIKNKLKITFTDQYDDTINSNGVISANYKKNDIVSEGTVIEVVLSKGKLKMEEFDSYAKFREWADKYGIKYEEQHEFSDSVSAGEVIKYSYNTGSTIKNDDVVIVTISDGKKVIVPSVKGLSKNEATKKLEGANLSVAFVYRYSSDVSSGKVISQSISSGSEVSSGTTVTIVISNGEKPASSGGNSGSTGGNVTTPTCTEKTYTVGRNLNNIFASYSGFDTVSSQLYSFFASNYPNVKISVVGVDGGDATSGSYIGGIGPGSTVKSCNEAPYIINIAK